MKVEEVENRFYDPSKQKEAYKTQLEWQFVLDKKPEVSIKKWTSANLSIFKGKKSNCLQLVEELEGKTLSAEDRLGFDDTDLLIGKKLYLTIKQDKTSDGETYAKIVLFERVSDKT
jgi:hypothetical protein